MLRPNLAAAAGGAGALSVVAESATTTLARVWPSARWNFSRHAATFRTAEAFVVSIPKSGRTWVRVFLAAYSAERGKHPSGSRPPRCVYTHDLWEHGTKGHRGERLRGKWLIPRADAAAKPILLVARDPRDVMVSLYFHLHKRARTYAGDLPTLLHHPTYGVRRVVEIMNRWLREWARPGHLHLLRYEDASADAAAAFGEALRFLASDDEIDPAAMHRALAVADFENMRRLESGDARATGAELVGAFREQALCASDAHDPDSRKVRRGKVGGFMDYLAPRDISFLDSEILRLDPRYGYRPV